MSVQTAIFSALGPFVGGRCYPNTFMQQDGNLPAWPAVRYTLTSEDAESDLCGSAGLDGDDTTVQVDVVSTTYAQTMSIKAQTIAALNATDPPCSRQPGGFEVYDEETKTHRCVLFYEFHASA